MKMDSQPVYVFIRRVAACINEVGFDLEQLTYVSVALKSNENR